MRILIVEDDKRLAESLKLFFKKKGYAADYIMDGEAAERRIELYHNDYDLVVLDWTLPKKSGYDIAVSARTKNIQIPILMLTARDSVDDKISGLDSGADDYLAKPFSPEELFSRVKALLRRPKISLPQKLAVKDLILDPKTRKVFLGDKEVKLTLKEFALLEYLMRNPNRVLDREQIFNHIWDFTSNSFSNVVDVHMHFLRKKIEKNKNKKNRNNKLIETVPGIGYRFNSDH